MSENDFFQTAIDHKISFVQELINNKNDVEAGFFLCSNGIIFSFYSHKRIRTYPETGGVTVFSKSCINDKIREAGIDIIKKLNWSGLIMIEFLKDVKSNEYKIIEINPRIWGSILLAEFNNSNFIKSYIKLCLGKKIKNQIVSDKKYVRWVFPYDIIYFFKNLLNPFKFFKYDKNTCYINFTYSSYFKSLKFVLLTYFDLNKIKIIHKWLMLK